MALPKWMDIKMRFSVYLCFHVEDIGIEQIHFYVRAISHSEAMKAAMAVKDKDFPNLKLKNINIYKA